MYAVLQIGHDVYGVGKTPNEAIRDAAEWLDQLGWPVPLSAAVYGDVVVVPCSARFAARYQEDGGGFGYALVNGEARLLDELDELDEEED